MAQVLHLPQRMPNKNEIHFAYVDTEGVLIEFDPKTGEGAPLEGKMGNDVEEHSSACEDSPAQGVVAVYFGVDKFWHFDHYINAAERRQLSLWRDASERDAWKRNK